MLAGETHLRIGLIVEGGKGTVWWDDLAASRLLAAGTSSLSTSTQFHAGGRLHIPSELSIPSEQLYVFLNGVSPE